MVEVRSCKLVPCLALLLLFGCAHQVKRDPDASSKRLAVGQDYYSKQLVVPALVEIQRALELDPQNAEAYYMLGLLKMGQAVEHLEIAERSTCMHGSAAQVEGAEAAAKMNEAEHNFKQALVHRPAYSEAFDGLAVIAIYRKDFGRAIDLEMRARQNVIFAENVIAKGNLGWAYYGAKDLVRAEKELREAIHKAPSFCVGRYRLAQVLFDQGNYDQAAEHLTKVMELKCPIQEAYRLEGLVAQRLRDREGAREAFEHCTQLAPRSCIAEECRKHASFLSEARAP